MHDFLSTLHGFSASDQCVTKANQTGPQNHQCLSKTEFLKKEIYVMNCIFDKCIHNDRKKVQIVKWPHFDLGKQNAPLMDLTTSVEINFWTQT